MRSSAMPRPWIGALLLLALVAAGPGATWVVRTAAAQCPEAVPFAALPLDAEGRTLVTTIEVNGQPTRMLLDTGASVSALFQSAAKRLDVEERKANATDLLGLGGETSSYVALLKSLKIGAIERRILAVTVLPDLPGRRLHYDGLIGSDWLRDLIVDIDATRRTLTLSRAAPCESRAPPSPLARRARFRLTEAGHIEVAARLAGKPFQALVDSGASVSLLAWPTAEGLGIRRDNPGLIQTKPLLGIDGNPLRATRLLGRNIAIGDIAVPSLPIALIERQAVPSGFSQPAAAARDALIGVDLFYAGAVRIDYANRDLWLTPYLRGGTKSPG